MISSGFYIVFLAENQGCAFVNDIVIMQVIRWKYDG